MKSLELYNYLRMQKIGEYPMYNLECNAFIDIYCKRCVYSNFRVVTSKASGNNSRRFFCINKDGCIGDCKGFYPKDERVIRNIELQIKEKEVEEKMKGILTKGVSIPDGIHKGKIVSEEIRDIEYQGRMISYLDFKVTYDETENTIKFGFPHYANPSEKSSLGRFLAKMGVALEEEFDTEKDILGKSIQYQTITDDSGFAKVIIDTIKKIK